MRTSADSTLCAITLPSACQRHFSLMIQVLLYLCHPSLHFERHDTSRKGALPLSSLCSKKSGIGSTSSSKILVAAYDRIYGKYCHRYLGSRFLIAPILSMRRGVLVLTAPPGGDLPVPSTLDYSPPFLNHSSTHKEYISLLRF